MDPVPSTTVPRTLLLVDDEDNIVAALKRLLRREGYVLLTANGGEAGLEMLARQPVDVILSDQRMPGMTGVEFLRRAKALRPDSVRMVLSGYTELQSVTSAINEGAIYKFLTKPWDDELLKANIAEAFHHKELADENNRLSAQLQQANQELAAANVRLELVLAEKQRQIVRDEQALEVLHEVLQLLPWPLVGVDDGGMIASINEQAEKLFGSQGLLLGCQLERALPASVVDACRMASRTVVPVQLGETAYRVLCRSIGQSSSARGQVLIFLPEPGGS